MILFLNILKAIFFGYITGFIISIPLGPAGIESVKRTISSGYKEGFSVSLGSLFADVVYIFLINCGLSSLLSKNKKTEALFWIISGLILCYIGYTSIKNQSESMKFLPNRLNSNTSVSLPFLSGFMITFSNPMTLSTWLFMSGTVIRAWYYVNLTCYYIFILSIMCGMVTWFALLNYFALKGVKILTPSTSRKTSVILMICIFFVGIIFTLFGFLRIVI